MKRLIIDTDPGHDDIMAILTALAHCGELELLSFCTVAGNQTVDKVTDNILKVEDYLNLSIPVYKGEARPLLLEPKPQPQAHGESGMDGPILPAPKRKIEEMGADRQPAGLHPAPQRDGLRAGPPDGPALHAGLDLRGGVCA